jgi:hypothetical protein
VLPEIDKALVKEGRVLQARFQRKLPAAHLQCTSLPGLLAGQVQREGDGVLVFLRLVVVERLAGEGGEGEKRVLG